MRTTLMALRAYVLSILGIGAVAGIAYAVNNLLTVAGAVIVASIVVLGILGFGMALFIWSTSWIRMVIPNNQHAASDDDDLPPYNPTPTPQPNPDGGARMEREDKIRSDKVIALFERNIKVKVSRRR